jgi:uncharacterized protein
VNQRFLRQFRPTVRVGVLADVTLAFLEERGLSGLILDLDNTLVLWHGREVPPASKVWVAAMQEAGIGLCLLSNTHRPGRLKALAQALAIPYVPGAGKPARRGFLRAVELLGLPNEQVGVLGDQLLTDVWGGNRCGLCTILVEPLSHREFIGTRLISRRIERFLLRRM